MILIYPIFYLLKGDYIPKPQTLNSSFVFLFHFPNIIPIFYLLKGDYKPQALNPMVQPGADVFIANPQRWPFKGQRDAFALF